MLFYSEDDTGFLDSLTACAKNRAGFGTLSFLLNVVYIDWFIIILLFCPLYF